MKRLIAAVLLAAMLFSLAACGGPGGGPGGGGPTDDNPQTYEYLDNLPDKFNGAYVGEELVVAVDSNYYYELYGEENSKETVDQLVYKRNTLMNQRFGVTIVADETTATGLQDLDSHFNYVRDELERASAEFDLIMLMAYQTGKLITSGYYLDWLADTQYCKESMNAGAEWWPEDINVASTVLGHRYLAVSDMCLTSMEMCYSVLFNKDMESGENVAKKQFNTATLYEAVDKGEWTIDAFYNIVKDFYRDSTTSGIQQVVDKEDRFGLAAGGGTDSDAWAFALGFQYIHNDGINMPELWTVSGNVNNAINSLRDLLHCDATFGLATADDYATRTQFFVDGHALFDLSTLEQLKREVFHDMDSDYGILPYPKLSLSQKQYLTGTMDHYTMLSIPLYIGEKLEMADVLVEAMSAESCNSVKAPYFESMLKYNSTRDENSVRMIDIIMKGRRYDLTTYHYAEIIGNTSGDEQSLGLFFRHLLKTDLNTDASTYYSSQLPSYSAGFEQLITDYVEMY